MLFPVLSAVCCLFVTAVIATGGTILMMPAIASAAANGEQFHPNQSPLFLLGMFTLYVANYFVIVFFNVALVGVANSRLMGGTWTFRDGIELAWARKGTILQWALVAATVGVVLGFALLVLYLLMLSVMMSAVQGIFNAALYRYACFKQVPPAFDAELVTSAWAPKN